MYRFVAFRWDCKDLAGATTAHRLARLLLSASADYQCVLDIRGLRVFQAVHAGGAFRAYVLKRRAGIILGKVFRFEKGGSSSNCVFDDKESTLIVESQGRRIVDHYWGHYVAFLQEADSGRTFVLRDPAGGLPCYLITAAGISVFLSDMEDCIGLKLPPFSVDWNHITAFFANNRLVTRSTGFTEVTHVHAGECLALQADHRMASSFHWNPIDIYRSGVIDDPTQALASLRLSIQHCIQAWSSCYESIVHELSGGLDSSIVAACLANGATRPDVLCFHFFTEMSEGDERPYARAAAQNAGCELVESEAVVSERPLESLFHRLRIATPARLGFLPASEQLKHRLVSERHAGAIFTGQGGDHLFQQGKSKYIAAEYVYRHGIRPELFKIVADTSRLTSRSVWSILYTAIAYGWLRRPFSPYSIFEAPSILTDDARDSLNPDAYAHPWLENSSQLPPSKAQQILSIVDCQPFYLRPCPSAEQVHPLISVPIIECSLRIPAYILAHRGRSRGLVRDAFAGNVPAKIINRYSKGGTTSYFNRLLVNNATFLRGLLLDGALVSNGILDRRELEKQLSERELILGNHMLPILNAARAEEWLRIWANVNESAAA